MKNFILLLSFCFAVSSTQTIMAQTESNSDNLEDRHPIFDYGEKHLTNVDTILGFDSKVNKLKVSGTIYEADGVTPAANIMLYIEQPDEHGDFDLRKENGKRYVYNRAWVKTNANGQYTFYTYVPGGDRRYNMLQQIHPSVKAPNSEAYDIASFVFDDDPLLTKRCRKQMAKRGDITRILKPKLVDGLLVVQKDIVLSSESNTLNESR